MSPQDLMNKQVAAELGLSEITVKIHRGHIMRKMGVRSLADLVRAAEALELRQTEKSTTINVCMISLFRRSAHDRGSLAARWPFVPGLSRRRDIVRVSKAQIVSIVDDDASVRAAMESLVRSLGFVAFVFESAEDFLRSPRVDDSACLITDVQMPGMSGLDLQDRLIAQGSRIPIIFITAFPEQAIRSRAQAGGALAFLEKPFGGRTMIELLRQALAAQPR